MRSPLDPRNPQQLSQTGKAKDVEAKRKLMKIVFSVRSCLFALVMLVMSASSFGQVGIAISFGPPAIPVYEQPICPSDGYIWTPGYWAYDNDYDDYYWVPGTWVMAPEVGFLWTPGYWAWGGEGFIFHQGYWGPQVGFYGGINYGFGYFGNGYEGGRWDHDRFYYNRSVTNVNVTNIHNVYNTTVVNNTNVTRVSYNGGNGGVNARPTPEQETAERGRHLAPVAAQTQQLQAARTDPQQRASMNRGKPPVAATPRPGALNDRSAVQAKQAGGPYTPPSNRGEASRGGGNHEETQPRNNQPPEPNRQPAPRPSNNVPRPDTSVPRPGNPVHARDLQPHDRPAPPNTGNPKLDQKYQQEQAKLAAKEEKDHQKLQQKQDQQHQKLEQQKADEGRKQQVEQQHQQQTQKMEQRHAQQEQHIQQREQAPSHNQPPAPKPGHNEPRPPQ
jgi:hypothetical protein